MMCKVLILSFFLSFSNLIYSQETELKIPKSKSKIYKQALKAVELNDNFLAQRYFDALIEKGLDNQDQQFEYAKLLYKLGDFKKSLENIRALIDQKYNHLLVFYYAALLLNSEGKTKESKDYALFFLKKKGSRTEYPVEHTHLSNLKLYLDSFNRKIDTMMSSVYSLEGPVNNSGAEFNPLIVNDGIMFGSQDMKTINYYKSTELNKSKHKPTRAIYSAKGANEVFKETSLFPLEIANMEVSSFCYNLDKRVIYMSGCRYNEELKKYKCDIYQSKFKDKQWTTLELIPELTTDESSNTHVNIGFDAIRNAPILFFASDRVGGRGGFDIYMSFFNTRSLKFSAPRNAGGKINTPKDDITPNYHMPTNTLYFSSNGRGGKGGHDIYFSKLKDGFFENVETFGAEINSPQDDVFFTPNKSLSDGYLVSSRYSENSLINPHCCDDIFYWEMSSKKRNKNIGKIKILAIDKKTKEVIPNFSYQIFKIDSTESSFIESGIGQNEATVKELIKNTSYEVTVYSSKYYRKKSLVSISGDSVLYVEFDMEPLDFNPILLPLVEFDFDSFTLTPLARHIIDSLAVPVLVANPTLRIELSAHTDSRGTDEYNESLSQKRADAIRFYLIDAKKIEPQRLESKGYGEYAPIAPNELPDGTDNPEGRQRNRRCEFRILQDEYDPY